MSVTIYGASDDLIEVEGDIREEFTLRDEEESYLGFSDGTVLAVEYTDSGFWRVNRVAKGTALYSKTEGADEDTDYSDRVTLTGEVAWVVFGSAFMKAKAPA